MDPVKSAADALDETRSGLNHILTIGRRRISDSRRELMRLRTETFDALTSAESDIKLAAAKSHDHIAFVSAACEEQEASFRASLVEKRLEMASTYRQELGKLFETHREANENTCLSEMLNRDARFRRDQAELFRSHTEKLVESRSALTEECGTDVLELEALKSEDLIKVAKQQRHLTQLEEKHKERKRYARTIKHRLINLRGSKFHLAEEFVETSSVQRKDNLRLTADILRLGKQYEMNLSKLSHVESINSKKYASIRCACESEIREQGEALMETTRRIYSDLFGICLKIDIPADPAQTHSDDEFWEKLSEAVPSHIVSELEEIERKLEKYFALLCRIKAGSERLLTAKDAFQGLKQILTEMNETDYRLISPPVLDGSIMALLS